MNTVLDDEFCIAAREVYRHYRVGQSQIDVLKGVSVEVKPGEILFLCGASGAGKTTLLYTLAGLERPSRGSVYFEGRSFYKSPRRLQAKIRNQRMGYVFQNYYLLPELTALENVMLPSLIAGLDSRERAASLLEQVGLKERMAHLPTELSGGEQQRVAIARAMVNDPDVLFADEPTGNLDSKTGRAVMETLLTLARQSRKTLIVVTHDARLAALGERILQVVDGQVV